VLPQLPYRLRPMRLSDLDEVMAIEADSFPTPWPRSGYEYELASNSNARYIVLLNPAGAIAGYAGQWLVAGEGHISIMAVAPAWRGRGLGELLLSTMIEEARQAGAERVLLEVRTGNQTAQALYRKYQFEFVGRRPNYYRDTGEDALLMTLELHAPGAQEALAANRQALWSRLAKQPSAEEDER
jgi:[ribosomal protein S18]-alanine N-acetyltransferase